MSAMSGCDAVVNFAAETHVDRSIHGASEFIETDVRGVYHIVEAAKKLGTQRVLLVSTDEVYGSIDLGSFKETDPVRPRNPYAASKAGGELLGMAYYHTFGTPVIVTRGSNTYGPYQYPEKVLPLFVTNAIDNQPLPLYKGGEHNVRDWLFVDDHCSGIDLALRQGVPGEVYNVAGGSERENIVLTRRILELTGRTEDLIKLVPDRPGHDRRYSIDASKLNALGWRPAVGWDEGIALTVRWYQENEWWWRKIKTGEYLEYYNRQYGRIS
jgi:dTDP-glucose 4,6-dehydratase